MKSILKSLDLSEVNSGTFASEWIDNNDASLLSSFSPNDGTLLGKVTMTSDADYEKVMSAAVENFSRFSKLPAPRRGEIVRQIADEFRSEKEALSKLISLEVGKIRAEAEGEVQEVIDIADFAVGLSRQLYGKTMHSERQEHRMYEQWHPLGNVAVITAFNFPAAVWAWNAMLAAVCGNSVIWKASELTPLTAIATIKICNRVTARHGFPALFTLITGDGPKLGQKVAADPRFPLVSATGSCRMGRSVAATVAGRFGRSLLELGGNNAVIVLNDANLDLAVRAVVFGAVGTAGQRCTTTRRVLVQEDIRPEFTERLVAAYKQVKIGDPLDTATLVGPLITPAAVDGYDAAVKRVAAEGGRIIHGGKKISGLASNQFVEPTIVDAHKGMALVKEETFAPILYIIPVKDLDEALALNNDVPQGLSSAIFTESLTSAEKFLSHAGSDCGIANVNLGTSGAEIGGAFGGEKETGGGREAGSDSWQAYMRRQTNTINWGNDLPLAQGIKFGSE